MGAVVPRVMPTIVPRAYGSHHGEPRPVNAGTTNTPSVSGTDVAASGPVSAASSMMPSPSRSHWMAAPVTKIGAFEGVAPFGRRSERPGDGREQALGRRRSGRGS